MRTFSIVDSYHHLDQQNRSKRRAVSIVGTDGTGQKGGQLAL